MIVRQRNNVFVTEARAEFQSAPSEVLMDRYRCPQNLFDVVTRKTVSNESGFFRFGQNSLCYGRSCPGTVAARAEFPLYDVIGDVRVENAQLRLPFDLKEVIDTLRLERYVSSTPPSSFKRFCKKLYYNFRPFTNQAIRKQVQKFHARDWKKRFFPHWPVDTTVECILETVLSLSMNARGLEKIPFIWFWPYGASACLTITHDVETRAGRDFCSALMDVDAAFGVKASFGIVPEERYEVTSDFLESIRSRGFEVVIQDLNHDGRLFDDKHEFLRRAKLINRYRRGYGAQGFRAAALYRNPEWFTALDFEFDMSFPNVAHLDPQQGGCCTAMPFFIGDILELPLTTIQDYQLFHVLNERCIDLWKAQTNIILAKNGLISFIVHPDYVLDGDKLAVYKDLLRFLRDLREKIPVWCALPSEINGWWRARSKMSIVKDGSSWRIIGEGAERAVLAFARNVGPRIVYELSSATGPATLA